MKIKEIIASDPIKIAVVIIGILGSFITIYAYFFSEIRNALQYEIIADASVLDIRADLSRLEILYNKSNLKEKKENLRIITIRVVNIGNVNILKNFYDEEDPLGLKMEGGNIIETPEVLECSNKYLKNNVKIYLVSPEIIRFSRVILEPREYFTVKLLVLHKAEILPKIIPVGKIAGIKSIKVVNIVESKTNLPFFAEVFSGTILVQLVRLFLYFLIAAVIITVFVLLTMRIYQIIAQIKRKNIVNKFKETEDYSFEKMEDAIFKRFLKSGSIALEGMAKLIGGDADDAQLNGIYEYLLDVEKHKSNSRASWYRFRKHKLELRYIRSMIKDGIITEQDNKVMINKPLKGTLERFLLFLIDNKYYDFSGTLTETSG